MIMWADHQVSSQTGLSSDGRRSDSRELGCHSEFCGLCPAYQYAWLWSVHCWWKNIIVHGFIVPFISQDYECALQIKSTDHNLAQQDGTHSTPSLSLLTFSYLLRSSCMYIICLTKSATHSLLSVSHNPSLLLPLEFMCVLFCFVLTHWVCSVLPLCMWEKAICWNMTTC